MSWVHSILTPGLVAAGVTVAANWWLQRPHANLRMALATESVDDADRLVRANDGDTNFGRHHHRFPAGIVHLTNYGDGTAHDIRLSGGERCKPRVWIGDSGVVPMKGQPAEVHYPMWSDTVAALEPGETVSIHIIASEDRSLPKPIITASWPRLPGRGVTLGCKTLVYDLANARHIEIGWPGG